MLLKGRTIYHSKVYAQCRLSSRVQKALKIRKANGTRANNKSSVASRKTTTRKSRCFCALHRHDRMLMSSCHVAFEHRHHLAFFCIKLFFLTNPILFSKRPVSVQT